jgi:hypothetical protein
MVQKKAFRPYSMTTTTTISSWKRSAVGHLVISGQYVSALSAFLSNDAEFLIVLQPGLISQANGSAYIETEKTKIACAVYVRGYFSPQSHLF